MGTSPPSLAGGLETADPGAFSPMPLASMPGGASGPIASFWNNLQASQDQAVNQYGGTVESDLGSGNYTGAWNAAVASEGDIKSPAGGIIETNSASTDPLVNMMETSGGLQALDPSMTMTPAQMDAYYQAFGTATNGGTAKAGSNPYGSWGNVVNSASGLSSAATTNAQSGGLANIQQYAGAVPSQSALQTWAPGVFADIVLAGMAGPAAAALAPEASAGAAILSGGATGAATGAIGATAAGALVGAAGGAIKGDISGGNIGKDALMGAIGGGLAGAAPSISNSLQNAGLGNTAANAITKGSTSAVAGAVSGQSPLVSGLSAGVGSEVGGATGSNIAGSAAGQVASGLAGSVFNPTQQGAVPSMSNIGNINGAAVGGQGNNGNMASTDTTLGSTLASTIPGLLQAGAGTATSLAASNAQTQADQNAITTQQGNLANINNIWGTQQALGQGADTSLGSALGTNGQPANYSNFENMPGYSFAVGQGTQAIDRSAAAMGNAYTPNTSAAVGQYVTGTAMQDYNTYISQLMGAAGLGSTANTALQAGSQQSSNNISTLQQNIGHAQAAGISGVGSAVGGLFSPNGAGTSLVNGLTGALTNPAGSVVSSGLSGVGGISANGLNNNVGSPSTMAPYDPSQVGLTGPTFNPNMSNVDMGLNGGGVPNSLSNNPTASGPNASGTNSGSILDSLNNSNFGNAAGSGNSNYSNYIGTP